MLRGAALHGQVREQVPLLAGVPFPVDGVRAVEQAEEMLDHARV